ncbi:hypothetical protein JW710_02090 [Candidatus Dojkabacteria bacterium]|nr:hypothetical protein [Candidatus Dojkabacteria bacterium]
MFSQVLQKTTQEIAQEIVAAYNSSSGIFSNKINAEDLTPVTTIDNKIQYLFWVIQLDYATKSSLLYKNAHNLWEDNNQWVSVDYLQSIPDKELMNMILTKLHPRYPKEIYIRFKTNADKLKSDYSSKAINIVKNSDSANELLKRIRDFRGFGPKLGNLLTRTYIDILDLKYNDLDSIMPPVDIHDVRQTYEWGLINDKSMTNKNINTVKKIWNRACIESKVSWIKFDKALWLLGSEGKRTGNLAKDFDDNLGL